jgi:dihydrofolate synthase / folylpolyglutamate synthase
MAMTMDYPDSVEYLYSLGNESKTLKLDLEAMAMLLSALGNPQRAFHSVHVAGTNGKGSTSAMIEAGLRAAGMRTGLYTSPHLVEPTERIQVAGVPVTPEQFTGAFQSVHRVAEELLAAGRLELHPSYFDTVTAMAFLLFRDQQVDTAVIEVGLGGRLDSTNVLMPVVSVITPIDFDHEAILGGSIEQIAMEKAGILKPRVPAVFARQRVEAETVLEARAVELDVPVLRASARTVEVLEVTARGSRFLVDGLEIRCPLAGEHQIENAATAVATLRALHAPEAAIATGIAGTHWPGRLEFIGERPTLILDGAHNPAGARALAGYIRQFFSDRTRWLIYGAMRDKSVQEITEILFPAAQHVIVTAPKMPRAVRPETLVNAADHPEIRVAHDLSAALDRAREAGPDDVIFVTGSLYLVGEVRALLVSGSGLIPSRQSVTQRRT